MGFLQLRRQYQISHEVRRGTQRASRVVLGIEIRPSSIAANPVESREASPSSIVLTSGSVKKYISVVFTHPICGTLLQKS